jgi:DNA-binding SARP family transcriptional activator/tetratricopeptide (TPR) repeat protein
VTEFRLLGAVEIWAAGVPVDAGQPRQRALLAALLVDAGRPVAPQTLIDRLWGDEPPDSAPASLRAHLTRIRRSLEQAAASPGAQARLVRRSGGYVLDVDPDRVDLHRFHRLVELAREPHRPDRERVGLVREALALWRGEPLSGVPGAWAARTRDAWRQRHVDAVVVWALAEIRVDNPTAVIGPLFDLAGQHPFVEPLTAALMRALYAAGRPAEALELYADLRQRLADGLGADPGAESQALHQAILRGDLDPAAAAPPVRPPQAPTPAPAPAPAPERRVPALLPLDVYGFAGRRAGLARLDEFLAMRADQPTAVVVAALSGTAGVGKTALAVHWAHRVRDRFPDGQLYVNLRGFDPSGSVVEPAEAVRTFLDALGVPAREIPFSPQAQFDLYRSELSGRRMMVVLDNARDAEQVRPLLPGSPTVVVLVTSRNSLTSLVAVEGAHPLTVDLLTAAEAHQLLAGRLGPARITAEPRAVDGIVTRCARLPLALAIVAARAATHPASPLAALASALVDARGGLDALTGDDPATDMRAVFSWSYRALGPAAARLFRLLGLHPGPDLGAAAAASLAGVPLEQVRPVLAELTTAHMLTEHTPGRYGLHDVLHAYAAELLDRVEPATEREQATRRMVDHYLHTAFAADRRIAPHRTPIDLDPAEPGVAPEDIADAERAMAWFTAEHRVLLAAVHRAADRGLDVHTRGLAWALADFLDRQGHWHDLAATQRAAVDAAGRMADRKGQASALRSLAQAYAQLGRYDDAEAQFQQALGLSRELGHVDGQAHTHFNLAWLSGLQGAHRKARDHAQAAFELFRASDNSTGQAQALNNLGWFHAQLGDYPQALACCRQALPLLQAIGEQAGEAATWDSLAYIHHHLGQYAQAVDCYRHAVRLYRLVGDRLEVAVTLTGLGDIHHANDQPDAARDAWRQAVAILDDLGHHNAGKVRAKLGDVRPAGGSGR